MRGISGTLRQALVAGLLVLSLNAALAPAGLADPPGGHYCLAINGVIVEQRGTATCFADATSYAVAEGHRSSAAATNNSKAEAIGKHSLAQAENSSTATASGSSSTARAVDLSVAISSGHRSESTAITGSSASAYGSHSYAHAAVDSEATATGNCDAIALSGSTFTCTGP